MLANVKILVSTVKGWKLKKDRVQQLIDLAADAENPVLGKIITIDEPQFSMNATPAGAFFDLHPGRGMVEIATLFECQKLWIFYPPTPPREW